MLEFAEQEVFIPDGDKVGLKFRTHRQPYTKLWLNEVDSGKWRRFASVGPTQTGKTFLCCVIPLLYHLFEMRETVIFGLPSMDMAGDKWREDIEPAIQACRYRDELPRHGPGSRGGGTMESVKFRNGATLKFMTGGGSDKTRSAFTSRVLVVTEVDGMDEASESSREADKITQMEGRTRSYGMRARIYLECTASIEEGRIWTEYKGGSSSQIWLLCPLCAQYVHPEREDFHGWSEASNKIQAGLNAHFVCPQCSGKWFDDERREANLNAKLVHEGQRLNEDGEVEGTPKETDTLGFRWSAANNLFSECELIGQDEYNAKDAEDEENAEKEMRQFVWALPYKPPHFEDTPLDYKNVRERLTPHPDEGEQFFPLGAIPMDTRHLCIHVDIGKKVCYWMAMAFRDNGTIHIPEYDSFPVPQSEDVDKAILEALRSFRDGRLNVGWMKGGSRVFPTAIWADRRYRKDAVMQWVHESGGAKIGDKYKCTLGMGSSIWKGGTYRTPVGVTNRIRQIHNQFHVAHVSKPIRCYEVVINSDFWKSVLHERLATPVGTPGSISLYSSGNAREHDRLSRHLTAEKLVRSYEKIKGWTSEWETVSEANHWLDTAYNLVVMGAYCGWSPKMEPSQRPAGSWFAKQKGRRRR